jgi:hypothetical protein
VQTKIHTRIGNEIKRGRWDTEDGVLGEVRVKRKNVFISKEQRKTSKARLACIKARRSRHLAKHAFGRREKNVRFDDVSPHLWRRILSHLRTTDATSE